MAIHTFELLMTVSYYEYRQLRDYFFKTSRGLDRCCYEDNSIIYYNLWQPSGILLTLMLTPVGGSLHFRINPSRVIGNFESTALFTPGSKNMKLLSASVGRKLKELPLEEKDSSSLRLYRLDLCKDILLTENQLKEYMRLLHKGYSSANWDPSTFGDDRDLHSFRVENTRSKVTVYDKLYEIDMRHDDESSSKIGDNRIMRIEVALSSQGLRFCREKDKYDITTSRDWRSQILSFSKHGAEIMADTLEKIFLCSPYSSLEAASEIISKTSYSRSKKDEIFSFLKDVNRCKRVDKFELRHQKNGKNRLEQLTMLGINPVTIEARSDISFLPSLCQLVQDGIDPLYLLCLAVGSGQIISPE